MTQPDHPQLTDEQIDTISRDVEHQEFTDKELAAIRKTRRRTPVLGSEPAEVVSFRAPPSYKRRVKTRAARDNTTESQVMRDALDSYLG